MSIFGAIHFSIHELQSISSIAWLLPSRSQLAQTLVHVIVEKLVHVIVEFLRGSDFRASIQNDLCYLYTVFRLYFTLFAKDNPMKGDANINAVKITKEQT